MFRAEFLGHQGWLIGDERTAVLLDPLLEEGIGQPTRHTRLFPPRQLDLGALPPIAAVLLSHEHEDHFDLPSLHRLPRTVPIYLPVHSSRAARRAIARLGFPVRLAQPGQVHAIGSLRLHCFAADHLGQNNADEWDVQPLLLHDEAGHGSFFSAVDIGLSRRLLEQASAAGVPPGLLCLANNSVDLSAMQAGLVHQQGPPEDSIGIAVHMLRAVAELRWLWQEPAAVAITGGGFRFDGDLAWLNACAFPADSRAIAAALGAVLPGVPCRAPAPGDQFVMAAGRLHAFAAAASRWLRPMPASLTCDGGDGERAEDYLPASGKTALGDGELAELCRHLDGFARHLYGSRTFRTLLSLTPAELGQRQPGLGLALRLSAQPGGAVEHRLLELDVAAASFREVEPAADGAPHAFGFEC
jgi:hypothetical protein